MRVLIRDRLVDVFHPIVEVDLLNEALNRRPPCHSSVVEDVGDEHGAVGVLLVRSGLDFDVLGLGHTLTHGLVDLDEVNAGFSELARHREGVLPSDVRAHPGGPGDPHAVAVGVRDGVAPLVFAVQGRVAGADMQAVDAGIDGLAKSELQVRGRGLVGHAVPVTRVEHHHLARRNRCVPEGGGSHESTDDGEEKGLAHGDLLLQVVCHRQDWHFLWGYGGHGETTKVPGEQDVAPVGCHAAWLQPPCARVRTAYSEQSQEAA
jgi:hypothetical protein